MRPCLFYLDIEDRSVSFAGAHRGVFHGLGTYDGNTMAIVEAVNTKNLHMIVIDGASLRFLDDPKEVNNYGSQNVIYKFGANNKTDGGN